MSAHSSVELDTSLPRLADRQESPRPALSLRANFAWTFVGNVVYAASQWAMLVVLAKLGTPEMVGQFALGLAVTAPVIMFANLQLRGVQATDAKGDYQFGDYLSLRLVTTGIALMVIVAITFVSSYRDQGALVIVMIGLAKAFEAISDIFYGLLQQHERMDRIAKSMLLKGPLSLVALGLGVYVTRSVFWGTVGLAVAWALLLVLYDVRSGKMILRQLSPMHSFRGVRPRWEPRTLWKLTTLALPLGVVMLLISLNTNIPRYFIEHYFGTRDLGIFSAMAYLMVAGNTVVGALGQSASPRLAHYYAVGKRWAFTRLLLQLVGIAALLGLGGVLVVLLVGREILTLLYKPEYAVEVNAFVWLTAAAGIGYIASFLGYAMTAARYFKVQAPLSGLVTGATALACLWLVPRGGLSGAAFALLTSSVVQALGSLAIVIHALYREGQATRLEK